MSTSKFTISVIISTFKRPSALEKAVSSLAQQTRLPDQLVLVTKVCDPETENLVRVWCSQVTWPFDVSWVSVSETSIAAAETAGIRKAHGDIVCFIDDDAVARPDWLGRIVVWFNDPSIGAVGGRDVVHAGDHIDAAPVTVVGRLSWFGQLVGNHHGIAKNARDVDYLKGVNMSYRRGALVEPDPRLVGDFTFGYEVDMGLSAKHKGFRVIYDPTILVDHFPRPKEGLSIDSNLAFIINHNQTYLLLKHQPVFRRVCSVIYTLAMGDKATPGVLRLCWELARGEMRIRDHLVPAVRGKIMGFASYVQYCLESS